MKGYLYKEWKQNRILFLLAIIIAVCVAFLPLVIVIVWKNTITKEVFFVFAEEGIWFQILCVFLGFTGVLALQDLTLRNDDRKSWGYFVASNPKGIKGYIFIKYVMVALMSMVFFAVSAGCDYAFTIMAKAMGDIEICAMTKTLTTLMFVQLLIQAVDIPFGIRFGVKKGNTIKSILMMSPVIIFILLFLFNPEGVADLVSKMETYKKLLDLGEWFFPVFSIILYVVSGMVSCKLYLKGVHHSYR